jgi:hypothetical protein
MNSAARSRAIAIVLIGWTTVAGRQRHVAYVIDRECLAALVGADAAFEREARGLVKAVAETRREGSQVRWRGDAPIDRQREVARQAGHLEGRHDYGSDRAMHRELALRQADACAGEHPPFTQHHRVQSEQLSWCGSEKNECRQAREGCAPPPYGRAPRRQGGVGECRIDRRHERMRFGLAGEC